MKKKHLKITAITKCAYSLTYHSDIGILFEKFSDFGELVLEVIDPDIADICAFTGVSFEIRLLIFIMLL